MKIKLSDPRSVLEERVRQMLARNKWEVVRSWLPTCINTEETGRMIVWLEPIARRMKECRVFHTKNAILVEWEYGPAHYALTKNDEPKEAIYGSGQTSRISSISSQLHNPNIQPLPNLPLYPGGSAGYPGGALGSPALQGGPSPPPVLLGQGIQSAGFTAYGNPTPGGHNQAATQSGS